MGEFELIERYFGGPAAKLARARGDVVLGIGDDSALLVPPPGRQLVAALDTLVEGRHFPHGSAPHSIGHRALAVNLSDLAAMGADPAWFLLALTLPAADEDFLQAFASGMLALAAEHEVGAGRWRHHRRTAVGLRAGTGLRRCRHGTATLGRQRRRSPLCQWYAW